MSLILGALIDHLDMPPAEFGPMPFWFWNDELNENELIRQLQEFHESGLGGVVIHPRVGLSPKVGYLTPEYFRLVGLVVDECARLGMKVILYDEGSYPSGSACGQVVQANPRYASRALAFTQKEVEGPWTGYWRPHLGRSLVDDVVCVVVGRVLDGSVDPDSLIMLEPDPRGLVRIDVGEGTWKAMASIHTLSGGSIRGVLPEEESGWATAPPAGDIMNPEAVAKFIELTHEAYATHLKDHMGTTVVAMFTDEPGPLGRNSRAGVKPFTFGFEQYLQNVLGRDDVLLWLPSLWVDYGPKTDEFRSAYDHAVHQRIVDVFYAAQASWCEQNGIHLTGHPNASNDMTTLSTFHWPGQDMVWRWVVPGDSSGLEGEHSVAAKAATSAARARGRSRIATELYGAYGWGLSLDEAKWLADWHLVRGNNLFLPHAFFYSIRGGRAYESEPDLGIHNVWWPNFKDLILYIRRMSWVLTEWEMVCDVAVVGLGYDLQWKVAKPLYQAQIDFLYVDEESLATATVSAGPNHDPMLHVGTQQYRAVIIDEEARLTDEGRHVLDRFKAAGGYVLDRSGPEQAVPWIEHIGLRSVKVDPVSPDLRVVRLQKGEQHLLFLSNEGEQRISGHLILDETFDTGPPKATWLDPFRMPIDCDDLTAVELEVPAGVASDPTSFEFHLERRESRLLLLEPDADHRDAKVLLQHPRDERTAAGNTLVPDADAWTVTDEQGARVSISGLGDWTAHAKWALFSGTLIYTTLIDLPADVEAVRVDLGEVGEAASVWVNGEKVGSALWSPYRVLVDGSLWKAGTNRLEVHVTNSMANRMEGAMRPSGLMGPVRITLYG